MKRGEDVKEKCIDVKVKIPIIYNVCKVCMGVFFIFSGVKRYRAGAS